MPTTYRYPVTVTSFEPAPTSNTQLICNNLGNPEWIDRTIANLKPVKILQNLVIDANEYGTVIDIPTFPYYDINDNGNLLMDITPTGGVAYNVDAYNTPYLQSKSTLSTIHDIFCMETNKYDQ